jgi:hypothetical protein
MNVYRIENRYIVRSSLSPQAKRNLFLLAFTLLLGGAVYWLVSGSTTSSVTVTQESICISATVKTGSYEMPAFNTASFRALSTGLKDTNFKASCAVDAGLELRYAMTFNAQKTSWQAELVAIDESGQMIWQGSESGPIENVGAFQYTTESTAEKLLGQFLSSR